MIGENCSILYDLRNIWKSITLPKVFLNSFFSSLHHETYVTKKKKKFSVHIYHWSVCMTLFSKWILYIMFYNFVDFEYFQSLYIKLIMWQISKKQSCIELSHSTLNPQSNHSWQSRPFLIRVKQIWHLHSVDVRVPLAPPHCCSANGVKFTFCLCFLPVYACSKLYT